MFDGELLRDRDTVRAEAAGMAEGGEAATLAGELLRDLVPGMGTLFGLN